MLYYYVNVSSFQELLFSPSHSANYYCTLFNDSHANMGYLSYYHSLGNHCYLSEGLYFKGINFWWWFHWYYVIVVSSFLTCRYTGILFYLGIHIFNICITYLRVQVHATWRNRRHAHQYFIYRCLMVLFIVCTYFRLLLTKRRLTKVVAAKPYISSLYLLIDKMRLGSLPIEKFKLSCRAVGIKPISGLQNQRELLGIYFLCFSWHLVSFLDSLCTGGCSLLDAAV